MDREELRRLLVEERLTLGEIAERCGLTRSGVGKMAKRYGIVPPGRDKYAAKQIDPGELRRLIAAEATLPELADRFGVSITTVKKHLAKNGLRTRRAQGVRARRLSSGDWARTLVMRCRHHGQTEFQLDARGTYRCRLCRSERVAERRRKVKRILVNEAGGRCVLCGYDRCVRALHFHHRAPGAKAFGLSHGGYTHGIETLRREARKCILLCSNCHAEVESGMRSIV